MKRRQKATWFLSGILAAANKTLSVFTGVKVYVDDVQIDAGDTHGNPDAFIYNGTTYVAVAAVSNSLGEDVKWDGKTSSVYIGKHEGSKSYLLNVCPPYQTHEYSARTTYTMAGKKYANGFSGACGGWALFNLDGKYDTMSLDVGHIDGAGTNNGELNIYLDGELTYSLGLAAEMMPKHVTIPLDGAVQMKIELGSRYLGHYYAMCNIQVS